ncbi:DUF58 domain-containing protein [Paenibacillus soyae]|uniref:DUF58 domain-containing protein n=1 Tax=Paenibacillus soyae TaxID=2969249 RepID=A0A9X2S8T2_9BACL|nr:DUF58 domain-containing protein [Paenibacillus soyae]MCR2804485.1 DUF58 domain-containing protein [Paenibacillus soyae]
MSRRRHYRPRWAAWAWITAAFGCSLGAVIARGGAVEWFLLILLAGMAGISLLLPLAAIRGIAVSRALPEADATAGEELVIGLTLTRRSRLPLAWVAVEDTLRNESSMQEKEMSLRAVFAPLFDREMSARFDAKALTRGVHRFGTVTVSCGDPFGLTSIRRDMALDDVLTVGPAITAGDRSDELADASFLGARTSETAEPAHAGLIAEPSDRSEAWTTRNAGIGPETRLYAEGDSFRHLDFRAMARGRGLHTKIYPGAGRLELYVAIDSYAAPYGGDDALFDACIGRMLQDAVRASSENISVTVFAEKRSFGLPGLAGRELMARVGELKLLLARLKPSNEPIDWEGLQAAGPLSYQGQGRTLRMYTADWQNAGRWFELADRVALQGFRLELWLVTSGKVLTFAMREQARILEGRGIRARWLPGGPEHVAKKAAGEGGSAYAMG